MLAEKQAAHSDWILSIDFTPDGTKIISGSLDQSIKVFDAGVGRHSRHAVSTLLRALDGVPGLDAAPSVVFADETLETHGPYLHGTGFPAVNGAAKLQLGFSWALLIGQGNDLNHSATQNTAFGVEHVISGKLQLF